MEQRLIQEKIEQEDQPAGCTFHPQINPQSEKILAESLRRTASGDDDFSGFDEDNPLIERLPLYERAAIIDKETFEIVQRIRDGRRRFTPMGEMPILSGMLFSV